MTPNFAFLLSQDTLRLLMQVEGGWAELGHVTTAAPDMAERLGELRDKAQQKAPLGSMITKLVIPNDYIRYLSLPPGQSRDQVLASLEGATPYQVKDLVVDFETDAGGTQVAAVAREFLDEAEKFATDHGLPPVSFVANPREGSFEREIFFGPSKGAARIAPNGAALGPEETPMVIVPMPVGAVARTAAPSSGQGAAQRAQNRETPPTFASAQGKAPKRAEARRSPPKAAAPLPSAARSTPLRKAQTETDQEAGSAGAVQAQARALTQNLSRQITPAGPPRPAAKPLSFSSRSKPSARKAAPKPSLPKLPALGTARDPVFKRKTQEAAKSVLASPVRPQAVATPKPRRESFWARTKASLGASPGRALAFGGTALAGIAALVVAFYTVLPGSNDAQIVASSAGQESASAITDVSASNIQTGLMPGAQQTRPAVTATPPPRAAIPVRPPEEAAPAAAQARSILSTRDAQRLYAATGVWQKAPGAPGALRDGSLALRTPSPLVSDTQTRSAAAIVSAATLSADPQPLEPPSPPGPDERFVLDARGFVIPSAEGTRSPSGILVFAGRPEVAPPRRSNLALASAPSAPVAPQPEPTAPPRAQSRPTSFPPPRPQETRAPAPEQSAASADAIPEIQIGPEGIEIRLGRPAIIPPARPRRTGAALPAALPPQDGAASQASIRPPSRPSGGLALTALASERSGSSPLRPRLRPSDFEPSAEEILAAQEPDEVSPYAVAQAIRPTRRPRNIATIVATAQNVATTRLAQAPQAAPVATAARPSGPTASTVAARATQDNVISLNRINLIGVFGTQRNRRALVRLPNGRFVRVAVGERLDGGQVTAIGTSELQYTKNGRRVTLNIPS